MIEVTVNYEFDAESGILSLRMGGHLTRIRWIPKPLAEEQTTRGHWREYWPEQRLVMPAGVETGDRRIGQLQCKGTHVPAGFRRLIPEHVAAFVEPFQRRQWTLLTLLNDVPDVMAWGINNPVLAYCVANNAEFRGITEQAAAWEARRHCMQKQKAILKWLRFPAVPAMLKLLKKVIPEAAEPWMLRTLRGAIASDERVMERLSHHMRINFGMIALLVHKDMRTLVTRELLTEVEARSEERMNSPTADLLGCALNRMLQLPKQPARPRFFSHKAVKEFRDEMDAAFEIHAQKLEFLARKPKVFPSPPIPGTDSIVPITSAADLKLEGKEMGHCIASYATSIKKGAAYAYRVLAPERATLLLSRGADGRWQRSEFRRRFNARPGKIAASLVTEWLLMNQKEMMQ